MKAVLDASAVLAIVLKERGGASVVPYLGDSLISTVNDAEVMSRLVSLGMPVQVVAGITGHLRLTSVPLSKQHAVAVARLQPRTSAAGLSVGDRACIAVAIGESLPVVTADRAWLDLDLDIEVISIR